MNPTLKDTLAAVRNLLARSVAGECASAETRHQIGLVCAVLAEIEDEIDFRYTDLAHEHRALTVLMGAVRPEGSDTASGSPMARFPEPVRPDRLVAEVRALRGDLERLVELDTTPDDVCETIRRGLWDALSARA